MKILIIDQDCDLFLAFALQCIDAGHTVRVATGPNDKRPHVGRGLVTKVPDWKPHMKWADLIFVTVNGKYMYHLDQYHKEGYPIFGCNMIASDWENKRSLGDSIFRKAGLKTIPTIPFDNYDDAIAFVKDNPRRRFASKPDGDSADKSLSYCAKNAADLTYMLEKWKKKNKLKEGFILQEFKDGIEMAVGGYFGPNGFSKYFLENWEFKKLMNDDLGVATGEQGTILRYVKDSKLAEKVLLPLEDMLHGIDYTGYCDVNCIITPDGTPWPLEFTNRPGWPLNQIELALRRGDPAEWMVDLMEGKDTLQVKENKIACGVVLSIPDYPYSKAPIEDLEGFPIYGVERDNLKNVHLSEVMWGKAPAMDNGDVVERELFVTAGNYVLTVSGVGDTVDAAREKAYGELDKISVPNSPSWRTDIGKKLEKKLPELHKMGYGLGAEYDE